MKEKAVITNIRPAGDAHQVVQVRGGTTGHMHRPCETCPWRVDAVGEFPAEAFLHSAHTAYDMAMNTFACHTAGVEHPKTCAGFLLRGADHNLAVRCGLRDGKYMPVDDGGHALHDSYRDMAEANGVDPQHPALTRCR